MRVVKILNNNAFISEVNGEEIIVMGKGVAFQKKINDEIMLDENMKIFSNSKSQMNEKMKNVILNIPESYLEITDIIVEMLKKDYNKELHDIIYVSLTEHIHSAVERLKNGIEIKNPLLNEIKSLYRDEYNIAVKGLDVIKEKLGVKFNKDEAGYITSHIINAQLDGGMNNTAEITRIVQKILNIIEFNLLIDIKEESPSYDRVITHLKFLSLRVLNNTINDEDDELFEIFKKKYPECYNCVNVIADYFIKEYNYELTKAEKMYLIIYIQRLKKEASK
ncbi:PRD domain-containing protein [Fusobacterium mortiferum]|uniref:PRD domain-containing protein n=1 Tax=Fusobacterium mortiferum TaxID=850 RepID=UPI001955FCEB|nr:PRD domain-containing protein [uncultured Fusobacterium sp.]MBM6822990.1 PRD domain-containing protein [Fusobacterium mortiferum]